MKISLKDILYTEKRKADYFFNHSRNTSNAIIVPDALIFSIKNLRFF